MRAAGQEVPPGARAAKASSATAKTEDASSPMRTLLEPASPGGRNRGRLHARAGAAGQRPGVRLGRRRLGPARLRNRAAKPTKAAATTRAAWCPSPSARSTTWWRCGRRRRRPASRVKEEENAQQGDLLVRRQRPLRTARPRQRQPSRPRTSTPTPIEGLSSVRGIVRQHHHRRRDPAERHRRRSPPISLTLLRRSAHARTGTCPPNRTNCATAGGHARIQQNARKAAAKAPCSVPFTGLKPEPYEVDPRRAPKAKKATKRSRNIIGTPVAPEMLAGRTPLRPPSAATRRRNRANCASARRSPPRTATGRTTPTVHLPVAALRRLRRSRRQRRTRQRMRTDHDRQRPGHR